MLPSIHDHTLLGYRVSLEHEEIALRTIPDQRASTGPASAREIVFEGSTAHFFEHAMEGSILGHLVEWSLEAFVFAHTSQFAAGYSAAGWPAWWRGSVEDAVAFLQANHQHAFEITSSYGFSGWILAKSIRATDWEPTSGTCLSAHNRDSHGTCRAKNMWPSFVRSDIVFGRVRELYLKSRATCRGSLASISLHFIMLGMTA